MRYHRFSENKNQEIEISRKQYKIFTKKTEIEMLKYDKSKTTKKIKQKTKHRKKLQILQIRIKRM